MFLIMDYNLIRYSWKQPASYDILNYNILCKYEDFQMFDLGYFIHSDLKNNLYQLDRLRLQEAIE